MLIFHFPFFSRIQLVQQQSLAVHQLLSATTRAILYQSGYQFIIIIVRKLRRMLAEISDHSARTELKHDADRRRTGNYTPFVVA